VRIGQVFITQVSSLDNNKTKKEGERKIKGILGNLITQKGFHDGIWKSEMRQMELKKGHKRNHSVRKKKEPKKS